MAEIIASIAALVLIGTTFYALGCAIRARDKERREVALNAVILEFKPRQGHQIHSRRG
ncbi:MAG: hypothetical protein QM684_10715 [Rhizobium sp.]|uniref:hypothetical protein n=1 Tax=Rhizobium sp. SYY.PMSO TaxID=3382192 RepID=UPI00398FD1E2